jgi:hypothetical protein
MASFVMEGGVIKNNGNVPVSFAEVEYYQYGSGVYIGYASDFIMTGGEISGNGHSSAPGSGIWLSTHLSSTAVRLTLNGPVTIANNTLGFSRANGAHEAHPYLGGSFSSVNPIGIDLGVMDADINNLTWWLGKQLLRALSTDPAVIDSALAAKFTPVKCYLLGNTVLPTDVSDTIQYKIDDNGKIALNTN